MFLKERKKTLGVDKGRKGMWCVILSNGKH